MAEAAPEQGWLEAASAFLKEKQQTQKYPPPIKDTSDIFPYFPTR